MRDRQWIERDQGDNTSRKEHVHGREARPLDCHLAGYRQPFPERLWVLMTNAEAIAPESYFLAVAESSFIITATDLGFDDLETFLEEQDIELD